MVSRRIACLPSVAVRLRYVGANIEPVEIRLKWAGSERRLIRNGCVGAEWARVRQWSTIEVSLWSFF